MDSLPEISQAIFDRTLDTFFDEGLKDISDHLAGTKLATFIGQTARNIEDVAKKESPELVGRYAAVQFSVMCLMILNAIREQNRQRGTDLGQLPSVDIRNARAVAADMAQNQTFYQQMLAHWRDTNPTVLHTVISFAQTTQDPFSVIFACMVLWRTLEKQIEANKMNQQFNLGDLDIQL